jgi:hypothetical protein
MKGRFEQERCLQAKSGQFAMENEPLCKRRENLEVGLTPGSRSSKR